MDTFLFMVHLPSSKCVHQCACMFARGVYTWDGGTCHVLYYTPSFPYVGSTACLSHSCLSLTVEVV